MSTFCVQFVTWDPADLNAFGRKHCGLPAVQQHQETQTFPLLIHQEAKR